MTLKVPPTFTFSTLTPRTVEGERPLVHTQKRRGTTIVLLLHAQTDYTTHAFYLDERVKEMVALCRFRVLRQLEGKALGTHCETGLSHI